MPHPTTSGSYAPEPSISRSSAKPDYDSGLEKFPDHIDSFYTRANGVRSASPATTAARPNGYAIGLNGGGAHLTAERWQPRRDNSAKSVKWDRGTGARGHHRQQKSITQAFHNIRERSGSVSQNAHEIADALRAPISPKLIVLCIVWYMSSALTNTSSKSILNAFPKPATLTLVQFFFVAFYCITLSWLSFVFPRLQTMIPALRNSIRYPSREVIMTTLPLAAFQIGGHLLSSNATSKIPVSMVHTVKGLSPLFTVSAYRFFYNIRYPPATYYSLIPLTLGVMLACSGKHTFGGELLGLFYALLATVIFVTQNIFSKKLFNEAAKAEAEGQGAKTRKLDKLNLLCYSSGMAFLLTSPIWFWSEGVGLIRDFLHDGSLDLSAKPGSFDHGRLVLEFVFNGTFHFGQNIMAFVLLSMVSPVTYSVASLIKRVWVIIVAILWFWQPTTPIQAGGIALTALGLYLYDRANERNKADRRARSISQSNNATAAAQPLLPLNTSHIGVGAAPATSSFFASPIAMSSSSSSGAAPPPPPYPYTNGHTALVNGAGDDTKKNDDAPYHGGAGGGAGPGRQRGNSTAWLPPGTRQEDTWRYSDRVTAAS